MVNLIRPVHPESREPPAYGPLDFMNAGRMARHPPARKRGFLVGIHARISRVHNLYKTAEMGEIHEKRDSLLSVTCRFHISYLNRGSNPCRGAIRLGPHDSDYQTTSRSLTASPIQRNSFFRTRHVHKCVYPLPPGRRLQSTVTTGIKAYLRQVGPIRLKREQ
jgi:hypothetical protein